MSPLMSPVLFLRGNKRSICKDLQSKQMSTETTEKKTPTTKEQTPGTRIPIGGGIYRYKDLSDEITYHERPWLNGKRTWRALGYNCTKQTNKKLAEEEYHRRRTEIAAGRNPFGEETPEQKIEAKSEAKSETKTETTALAKPEEKVRAESVKTIVARVIQKYVDENYPDRYLRPRIGRTLEGEQGNCKTLLLYCELDHPWHERPWDSLTLGGPMPRIRIHILSHGVLLDG